MDFMLGVLQKMHGHDSFFIVVDQFLKMDHFLSCSQMYDASWVVAIFFGEVVHLHYLPKTIVSDCDVIFMSYF